MTLNKINESDIRSLKISSLPSRPTAPTSFGGAGYSAKQMKEAFDKLPLFIIERLNALIEAISMEGDEGIASSVPSGISDGHTLGDFLDDITSGGAAVYLKVLGKSLADTVSELREGLSALSSSVGKSEGDIDAFLIRLEDTERTAASALEGILTAKEELTSLEALISAYEQEISALEASVFEGKSEISALKLAMNAQSGEISSLLGSSSQSASEINALTERLTGLEDQHANDIAELREMSGGQGSAGSVIDCGSPADLLNTEEE